MEEKCFCHLNGFAVKDATARKQIEELDTEVTDLNTALVAHEKANNQKFNNVNASIDTLSSRITELEGASGVGESYDLFLTVNNVQCSYPISVTSVKGNTEVTNEYNVGNEDTNGSAFFIARVYSHYVTITAQGGILRITHNGTEVFYSGDSCEHGNSYVIDLDEFSHYNFTIENIYY